MSLWRQARGKVNIARRVRDMKGRFEDFLFLALSKNSTTSAFMRLS